MAEKEVKGYVCTCGAEHRYPPYVYAHWREQLTHKCDHCGKSCTINRGVAKRHGKMLAAITEDAKGTLT